MAIRNLDYIREKDPRLYEALADLERQQANITQQANGNVTGHPAPPPPIDGLKVAGSNGHFSIAIQDQTPSFRGVNYYVEHADNPNFTNPHVIELGAARNHNVFLGNVTRYWRAYSAYSSSEPSAPAYQGDASTPLPVAGGGAIPGPEFLPSEGSGTGAPGQGLAGPGILPWRSLSGLAPVRGGKE